MAFELKNRKIHTGSPTTMAHDLYYLLSGSATSADPAPFTVTATTGFAATFLATNSPAYPPIFTVVTSAATAFVTSSTYPTIFAMATTSPTSTITAIAGLWAVGRCAYLVIFVGNFLNLGCAASQKYLLSAEI